MISDKHRKFRDVCDGGLEISEWLVRENIRKWKSEGMSCCYDIMSSGFSGGRTPYDEEEQITYLTMSFANKLLNNRLEYSYSELA